MISAELHLKNRTCVVNALDPVPSELDDAHEGASKAGVDLACRAAVLEADLVPLLEVEQAPGVAGDLHPRPPSLAAHHLGPVVHLDGEAHLARLLQVAHLCKDQVETRTGNSNLSSRGEREARSCTQPSSPPGQLPVGVPSVVPQLRWISRLQLDCSTGTSWLRWCAQRLQLRPLVRGSRLSHRWAWRSRWVGRGPAYSGIRWPHFCKKAMASSRQPST